MRFVYLLVCLGLLTACGSDGGSDAGAGMNMGADGGSPPSTDGGTDPNTDAGAQGTAFDDAFSEEWADVICEKFETCFAVLSELSVGPNCREDWKNRATPAQDIVNASIDAGRINYDSAAWADCVAEARATSCDGLTFADIFALVACPEAIQGTVADGGDCLFWADCSPSSFCLETEGACGGVCTPKLTAGEACESDEACIDDVCTGVCAVKVEVGEPCDADDMSEDGSAPRICADGIECVVDEASGMATCTNLTPSFTAEVGEPCALGAPATLCVQSAYCGFNLDMTTECRQRAALGEACQLGFINSCEAGSACVGIDFESGVFEGTCEALPGQGEPCFPDDMIRCAPGFECGEGDVCGKQKALGEPCEDGSDCFSEYCAANEDGAMVCSAYPVCEVGEAR